VRSSYLGGLHTVLDRAGIPYGYTVTLWTSGQVLIGLRGTPRGTFLPAFAGGAALGYVALALMFGARQETATNIESLGTGRRLAILLAQVGAIAAAVGAVALVGEAPAAIAWPAGGFVATTLYLGGSAGALAIRTAGIAPPIVSARRESEATRASRS
jgi:hypothetical protein